MSWAVVASTGGAALTTLLGVVVGAALARRAQQRQWLKDAKSQAYSAVLREYTRVEFDLRGAYLKKHSRLQVDWAPWGGALSGLSLVAEDDVMSAAQQIADRLDAMDAFLRGADPHDEQWRVLQDGLVVAQMTFVNCARRSLDRAQPPTAIRIGGPLITEEVPGATPRLAAPER